MNKIKVRNIFAAVFDKSTLDPLLDYLQKVRPSRRSHLKSPRFWGTEGTVKYLKNKGFKADSIVSGFDFDGRVKSLDRVIFARILADRSKNKHLEELKKMQSNTPGVGSDSPGVRSWEPFDLVVVDLYKPDPKNFPESMDIGGQALIRAAVKNYKGVALAFDTRSLESLAGELVRNNKSTSVEFRKKQASAALKFIAERSKFEAAVKL